MLLLVTHPALLHRLIKIETLQRLAKWFTTLSPKEKAKIVKDVSQLVLSRRTRMCNFLEYKGAYSFCVSTMPQYFCGPPFPKQSMI